MGVKTRFAAEDLRTILSAYDVGDFRGWEPFLHGADQTNIKLLTTKGAFAFRYYEKRSTAYVLFEIDLLQYLAHQGFPSPAPIATRRGPVVGMYKEKPYALFTLLDGEHDDDVGHVRAVAREVARLHLLTVNYRPVHCTLRGSYDRAYCLHEAAAKAAHLPSAAEARRRLAWLAEALDGVCLPDTLPQGVCHRDTNPSNFLYGEGQVAAVLDFDQAGFTWLLYDVADLLYWWAWPEHADIDGAIAREALAGYEEVRPLTHEERRHLYDALLLINLVDYAWYVDQEQIGAQERIALLTALGRDAFDRLLD